MYKKVWISQDKFEIREFIGKRSRPIHEQNIDFVKTRPEVLEELPFVPHVVTEEELLMLAKANKNEEINSTINEHTAQCGFEQYRNDLILMCDNATTIEEVNYLNVRAVIEQWKNQL